MNKWILKAASDRVNTYNELTFYFDYKDEIHHISIRPSTTAGGIVIEARTHLGYRLTKDDKRKISKAIQLYMDRNPLVLQDLVKTSITDGDHRKLLSAIYEHINKEVV